MPSVSRTPTPSSNGGGEDEIDDLRSFLDQSPSPFHVVETVRRRLQSDGFVEFAPTSEWASESASTRDATVRAEATAGFVCRDGSLIAWRVPEGVLSDTSPTTPTDTRFQLVGAHTDSPNLRVTPRPEVHRHDWHQLHVEVYGGILRNSWLDRDLALAGRVVGSDGTSALINSSQAVARIPQLAIHLDRGVNDGLTLNPQEHLRPVWSSSDVGSFRDWLADISDIDDPVAWELGFYDHQPAEVIGADRSMLASGRLDNQVSCWAATEALINATPSSAVSVIVLNDHEEVGSTSTTGADGAWLGQVLERLAAIIGLSRPEFLTALARSTMVSADNAHAIHPNYPDRHEPRHAPRINRGVVVKTNVNQRYATSATTAAWFIAACETAGVEHQVFASKNTMPCGSTIGPMSAAKLGIDVIDVGIPQLSMHSAREVCGTADPPSLKSVLRHILAQ